MNQKNKQPLLIFLNGGISLIAVLGFSVRLPESPESPFQRIVPQSALWIAIFFLLWTGLSLQKNRMNKQQKKRAFITALTYFLCDSIGYFYKSYGHITIIWKNQKELLNYICNRFGYFLLFYLSVLGLFYMIGKYANPSKKDTSEKFSYKLFGLFVMILLIAWLPWYAHLFPGVTTIDSNDHLSQSLGTSELYDHHPILHTAWITLLYKIGGSTQNCLIIYSTLQMLFSAAVFAVCCMYFELWLRKSVLTAAALCYFALHPVFPVYGMTMWKDVPFGLCFLLVTINLCKIVRHNGKPGKAILCRNILLLLIMSMLRHNGFYLFIPTFLIVMLKIVDNRRFYLFTGMTALIVYVLFQTVGLPLINVKKGRISEGLSIPLQQIARVVYNHQEELNEIQADQICEYFNGRDIAELYKPTLSDPVKGVFDEELLKGDPIAFLRLWLDLGIRYPMDYIESVMNNSFGYWYPQVNQRALFFGLYFEERYELHGEPLLTSSLMSGIQDFLYNMENYSYPVLSWIFAPAYAAWVLFFAFQYCRLQKSQYWLIHVPWICLLLQMFGAPAFCELRYVYGFFTSLPLILCCSIYGNNNDVNRKEY